MRISLQFVVQGDGGAPATVTEIAQFERDGLVNYGDRYRHGEPIASGVVESAVNQVVSKRFVKRQQMAWRPRHPHNLLQIRDGRAQ